MFVLYIMELYLYKYMCKVELKPVGFEAERFMQTFHKDRLYQRPIFNPLDNVCPIQIHLSTNN